MRMPAASASGAMVRACWRTRSSVGAMIAAWAPASITAAAASSATTVLPEPTSPCSRRSMRSRPAEVGVDLGERGLLAAGQREGQGGEDLRAEPAVALPRRAGASPLVLRA